MKLFALLALSSIGVFTHVAGAPAAGDGTIGERKPLFDPLPAGAPDGLHIATLNEDGTTHWEYLGKADPGNSTVTNAPSSLGLDKRAKQGAYCQGGYIASSQFAGATQGLANMCGQGLNYATLISYQYGSAIAYGCNYGNGQQCHGTDVLSFFNALESACPNQNAWYSYPKWKVSYGVTTVGTGFC